MMFASNPQTDKEESSKNIVEDQTQAVAKVRTPKSKKREPVKLNRYTQKAKYDGRTKYEKPRYAHYYSYKYNQVDSSLPVTEFAYQWFKQTQRDALEYFLDMTFRMDSNAVMFKTAGFTKRQFQRVLSSIEWFGIKSWYAWQATKHGVSHMCHGLKTLFRDGKWVVKQQVRHQNTSYAKQNFQTTQRVNQVKKDFIKFVPFSLFLLIPGGELFLPAWVLIFPNSVPSQFVSDSERVKKFQELKDRQEDAAEKLSYVLNNYLAKLKKSEELTEETKDQIQSLKNLLKQEKLLPTDLLDYRNLFSQFGRFSQFRTKSLMHMAHFMSIQPVTGLNTINNILRLFKVSVDVELPVIRVMTQILVARELNMYFSRLRQEDLLLDLEDIDSYDEQQLTKVCFQRGINIEQSPTEQLKDLKLWLSISNKRNVPHILLLIVRLLDFQTNTFEVDQDETEAEILRRSKSDAYYIETMRAFEKAFGMDRLERIIAETQHKRSLLMQDPQKHKFIFQQGDLQQQVEALDEFTTRHRTITERINETYKIGNQMSDYLEKQIIIDFHFRGEQDIFEEEYEHLKSKAEKLLGHETYYECASQSPGYALTEEEQPVLYAKLMSIQKKITSELDENLAKHNVRIDQYEEDISSNTTSLEDTEKDFIEQSGDEELELELEAAEAATEVSDKEQLKAAAIDLNAETISDEQDQTNKKTMQEQS